MNAIELTKAHNDLTNRVIELEKQVKYLTQELEKQRLITEDLKVDVKMLSR